MSFDISDLLSTDISMISLTSFISHMGLFSSVLSIINLFFLVFCEVIFFFLILYCFSIWFCSTKLLGCNNFSYLFERHDFTVFPGKASGSSQVLLTIPFIGSLSVMLTIGLS